MVQESMSRLGRVCIAQRYILAIMGFLAVANAYTMRVVLSVAITEMVAKNVTCLQDDEDPPPGTCKATSCDESSTGGEFEWTESQQGLVLSSFFWGYVITHLPGGMLAERFGGKYSLGLGILSTAVFTLLTPVVANTGNWKYLMILRILEGLGEGTTFPALNALLAAWVPKTERSRLGSLVFAGAQIGTVAGTLLSGIILEYYSWPWVFYLFGGIGVLWFIIWTLICYSDPASHPYITEEERKYLEETVGDVKKKDLPPVPWRAIFTSVPLLGLICAQIGHDWGFFTMVTDLPKYMSDVMKFKISQNGLWSSLPYLTMWLMSTASSWVGDWMIKRNVMSITNVRKMFTTIASVGPACGIIAASYAGCNKTNVVILFTVAMTFMGTFYPGMKVNALDLSPNYAGTLMAIVNGIGAFSGIITPYLVGVLTPNSTLQEWRLVFWIAFGVFMGTNLVYVFTASGEVQPWNDPLSMRQKEMDDGLVEYQAPKDTSTSAPPETESREKDLQT
ncbi:hypothetical protein R5R35_000893 [Gryllus longicercus]|uniref:Major facilitator superfamily (MFS) profile domain-containing protein n=1 Tax=Gryllus longicercus TaxID=2509291 RepID=A0AAN9Z9L9_9ORTH|nr:Putative inorganic phosphate cotransporter [Gryllus bimaculatus]